MKSTSKEKQKTLTFDDVKPGEIFYFLSIGESVPYIKLARKFRAVDITTGLEFLVTNVKAPVFLYDVKLTIK